MVQGTGLPALSSTLPACKDSNLCTHHICNAAGCRGSRPTPTAWWNSTQGKENLRGRVRAGNWTHRALPAPDADSHEHARVRTQLKTGRAAIQTPSYYQLGSRYEGAADALNASHFSVHVPQRWLEVIKRRCCYLNNNISGYYTWAEVGLRRKRNQDKIEINCSCPPRKLKNVISGELLSKFCELRLVFAESLALLCLFILYS